MDDDKEETVTEEVAETVAPESVTDKGTDGLSAVVERLESVVERVENVLSTAVGSEHHEPVTEPPTVTEDDSRDEIPAKMPWTHKRF